MDVNTQIYFVSFNFNMCLEHMVKEIEKTGGTCDSCQDVCPSLGHLKPIKKLFLA